MKRVICRLGAIVLILTLSSCQPGAATEAVLASQGQARLHVVVSDGATAAVREKAGDHLTASRCSTEDIADAVLYLLRATSVTGETLFVDSGQRLLG